MTDSADNTTPPQAHPAGGDLTIEPGDAARSERLADLIRSEIRRSGPISFETFMERALYQPRLGYYAGERLDFGARGDFVTAPTLTPLFADCLAEQCAELLTTLDADCIVEFGAGDGSLAADLCQALQARNVPPGRYVIVEASAGLRKRQQRRLEGRGPYRWVLPSELEPFAGVALANEVLDAFPVQRFVTEAGRAVELGVDTTDRGFAWRRLGPLSLDEPELEALLGERPDGYCSEYNRRIAPWLGGVARALRRGAVLILDYGYRRAEYYQPERTDGTLRCHLRHRAHADPFLLPGVQDLTAAVDFSLAARAGRAAGMDLLGFTTQARFLIACGIDRALAARRADADRYLDVANQAKTLLLPDAMGERIKVMALGRGLARRPCGFAARDLRLD